MVGYVLGLREKAKQAPEEVRADSPVCSSTPWEQAATQAAWQTVRDFAERFGLEDGSSLAHQSSESAAASSAKPADPAWALWKTPEEASEYINFLLHRESRASPPGRTPQARARPALPGGGAGESAAAQALSRQLNSTMVILLCCFYKLVWYVIFVFTSS